MLSVVVSVVVDNVDATVYGVAGVRGTEEDPKAAEGPLGHLASRDRLKVESAADEKDDPVVE